MRIKTLSDYPGLIGQMLRRHEARERRRFKRRNRYSWKVELVSIVISTVAVTGTAYSLFWLVRFLFRL